MNRLTLILVLTMTVLLVSSGVCWSADFQKGLDAHERGDFVTALKEWTPLAEQGHASAQFNLGQMYNRRVGHRSDYFREERWSEYLSFTLTVSSNNLTYFNHIPLNKRN